MHENPRILIVDDDESAREVLRAHLWQEPYELISLPSGRALLEQFDALAPDVILLDVMMPILDGFEVCRQLKTNEQRRHIPVILITALESKAVLLRGMEVGADDFLSKPVVGLELRARVHSMARIKAQHDELAALLHLREDLTNMILHDMRNQLAAILLFSTLLQKTRTTDKGVEHLENVTAAARRLESFINDMLIVAKGQENRLVLSRQRVEVNQLLSATQEWHTAAAQQRGIALELALPETPWYLSLDEALFQRVLDNLLSNALKFSPSGTTVRVQAAPLSPGADGPPMSGPAGRIQVADEGPGIPEAYRAELFQKFNVVDLKQKGVAQVGLGLAFCKLVVEAHGGRISVAANTPTGAIFTVEI